MSFIFKRNSFVIANTIFIYQICKLQTFFRRVSGDYTKRRIVTSSYSSLIQEISLNVENLLDIEAK